MTASLNSDENSVRSQTKGQRLNQPHGVGGTRTGSQRGLQDIVTEIRENVDDNMIILRTLASTLSLKARRNQDNV